MALARIYARASTKEQDPSRALASLESFAAEHGLAIAARYIENESGTKVNRPELRRLLRDAAPGDVLLVEQVDRLSRLTDTDWRALRTEIEAKGLRLVALDMPTTHAQADVGKEDFTARMTAAFNAMLLDMLAAIARKDYDDRRRRQAQGQARAKEDGRYRGRAENTQRNAGIEAALRGGMSWSQVQAATGCGRAHVAKIAKRIAAASEV